MDNMGLSYATLKTRNDRGQLNRKDVGLHETKTLLLTTMLVYFLSLSTK